MVATSGGIPYPTGGDRPCDAWMTWRDMAGVVDARLTGLNADLDATAYGRPMAKVSTVTAQQLPDTGPGTFIRFDTVEVDTDSMVDIVGNPQFVVPPRAGIYHIVAFINFDNLDTAALPYTQLAFGANGGFDKSMTQYEFNWSLYKSGFHIESETYLDFDTGIGLMMGSSGVIGDSPRVLNAQMTVTWIGDDS